MKKLFLIISLIICYNAAYQDCSAFEGFKQEKCVALGNTSFSCYFSNGQCLPNYKQCSTYPLDPEETFVDNKCTSIISPNANMKCYVKTVDSEKTCDEKLKDCNEYIKDVDDCKNLNAVDNGRCVLYKGDCNAHLDECEGITSSNQCIKNIPKVRGKKCIWEDSSCQTVDRSSCEDFIVYEDKYTESLIECRNIEIAAPKSCFLDGDNCIEVFPTCESANDNEATCLSIKPLNSEKTSYDTTIKCIFDSTCSHETKKCADYKKGEIDCTSITSLTDTTNKICVSGDTNCKEVFKTCESYNTAVAAENRNSGECTSITARLSNTEIDNFSTCIFTGGQCKTEKKDCNKFNNNELMCNSHEPNDEKRCIFKNNECQEQYKNCDLYNSKVANKKKDDCEAIQPIYTDDTKINKCIFTEGTSTCEKEAMECEDYKGKDENYCNSISRNYATEGVFKCIFKGNQCIKEYIGCESYDDDEIDKKKCESIQLDDKYKKCILEKDKDCVTKNKICSDYSGNDEFECVFKYYGSDNTHSCAFINNKCYDPSIYKFCSDYKGSNKLECESILPYTYDESSLDPNSKCIYKENEGCIRQSFKCSDGKSESHCNSLNSIIFDLSSNKMCVFINNQCKEQYKTCELYGENESTVERTVCESMLIGLTQKCVYKAPATTGAKGSCETKNKICSDFKIDLLNLQCIGIELIDDTKKCEFSNNICSDTKKYCDELSDYADSTNEICNSAKVLAVNHICISKEDHSGCEEIINPNYSEPSPTTSPNQPSNPTNQKPQTQTQQETPKTEAPENNDNSGGKNIIKIMPYFLWILL